MDERKREAGQNGEIPVKGFLINKILHKFRQEPSQSLCNITLLRNNGRHMVMLQVDLITRVEIYDFTLIFM